jgi:hypothetical protein
MEFSSPFLWTSWVLAVYLLIGLWQAKRILQHIEEAIKEYEAGNAGDAERRLVHHFQLMESQLSAMFKNPLAFFYLLVAVIWLPVMVYSYLEEPQESSSGDTDQP